MKGPEGKYFFGTVKVGEKGQIVIPKEARVVFGIKPGDSLLLLGDEARGGLAVIKTTEHLAKTFLDGMLGVLEKPESPAEKPVQKDCEPERA